MNTIMTIIIPAIIGSSLLIGASTIQNSDIINSAWAAANLANRHQIRTVLELYYLDNNKYPEASNAPELFEILYSNGYIEEKPINPDSFHYTVLDRGEKYKFAIADGEPQ